MGYDPAYSPTTPSAYSSPEVAACALAVRLRCAVYSVAVVTRLKVEVAAFYFEQMMDAQVVHGISYLLRESRDSMLSCKRALLQEFEAWRVNLSTGLP
jgi:hypothetical protein